VIAHLTDTEETGIAVATLAGKAASVLRRKGVCQAQTLHSLLYEVKEDRYGNLQFFLRSRLMAPDRQGVGHDATMVIVDEASMVDKQLHYDLHKFNLPVLYVGDHGQLEPIGDNPFLMLHPRVRLETIHRQVADNPILRLATAFREGRDTQVWDAFNKGWRDPSDRLQLGFATDYQRFLKPDVQVICGFNSTRHDINAHIRISKGIRQHLPEPGDLLICLRNNPGFGVFNGQQAKCLEIVRQDGLVTEMKIEVEDGTVKTLPTLNRQYGTNQISQFYNRDICLYDYGYCVTAHKSQGSEWDEVMVIEELANSWDPRRWRYTVATRARHKLTYLR
jgi:exodeoxyribonuclease-5